MVKQTVMTSVYGVTRQGASDQIQKRLKERNYVGAHNIDDFDLSRFAAKVIPLPQAYAGGNPRKRELTRGRNNIQAIPYGLSELCNLKHAENIIVHMSDCVVSLL